jgi:folylpolyglutamate synthase/dihydropteroate synthase
MRPNKPAIYSGINARFDIIEFAEDIGADLYIRDKDFACCDRGVLSIGGEDLYLIDNMAVPKGSAMCAAFLSKLLPIDITKALQQSISSFKLPARFELIDYHGLKLVFDCAHNPSSIKNLVNNLNKSGFNRVGLWFSLAKTKDLKSCLFSLRDNTVVACISEHAQSLAFDFNSVRNCMLELGFNVVNTVIPYDQSAEILRSFEDYNLDAVVIVGSFVHVGMVKQNLELI